MQRDSPTRFETQTVAAGEDPSEQAYGDVVSPIHLASTFVHERPDEAGEYTYARTATPTRTTLEKRLAALEGGEHALALSAGMGAVGTALLSVLNPGAHVVAFNYLYGGTRKLLDDVYGPRFGVDVDYVDATSTEAVRDAVTDETALVYVESPTNPLMKLCDLEAIASVADEADATFCVDNTFASPALQRPLEFGADMVLHSTTKYINGHSDTLGGAIVTDDAELADAAVHARKYATGAVPSPFDAYLTLRGVKTLAVRMERHCENAAAIAEFLADHSAVESVNYPGLESHPQHELAAEQMDDFGGMLSFEIDGGEDEAAKFLAGLDHVNLAVSLGGVESLIAHTPTMTHRYLDQKTRDRMGITESLIRLSVGIEHVDDLIADLDRGLAKIE